MVDSFHDFDKEYLFAKLESDLEQALQNGISLNPLLNSFAFTVNSFGIDRSLIDSFMQSMRSDLYKTNYSSTDEYETYIYGSADVVGLMCLKVFVKGNDEEYRKLKHAAQKLGSAFQKVNFLRDVKADYEQLGRSYFPGVDISKLGVEEKRAIVTDIENDFMEAYKGIVKLPVEARLGVYTAYKYYKRLLFKLKKTPSSEILQSRIRVSNPMKVGLFVQSWFNYKFNLL